MSGEAEQSAAETHLGTGLVWVAVVMFAGSNSIVRRLTQLGASHPIDGRNPISFCNVLAVANVVAAIVLALWFRRQLSRESVRHLTRWDWLALVVIGGLSTALAPALIFTGLSKTSWLSRRAEQASAVHERAHMEQPGFRGI